MANPRPLLLLPTLLCLFGCGGQASSSTSDEALGGSRTTGGNHATGGAATATAGSGTGGTAGSSTLPAACQVPGTNNATLPQSITFNWVSHQTTTLYVSQAGACTASLNIYACVDGYTKPIVHSASCMGRCGTEGCVMCGMCAPDPITIQPGGTLTSMWSGQIYSIEQGVGCPCYNTVVAERGKYRVVLSLYEPPVEPGGTLAPKSNVVSVDFDYPDDDGKVTIEIPVQGS